MSKVYRESVYRNRIPMTHEQYLDEPARIVDYEIAIWGIERQLEKEAAAKKGT